MNVPFLNFFHNVSQSLSNPEFVSILGKKVIFSKGHPYSISILVSQHSPIMLASFKIKIWNVFCPAIFQHFRMVCINDLFFSMFSGLYPGDHNIIANQFADENSSDKKYFDKNNEDTTGHLKWWHNNEPIWATANKNHKNFSTFLWSRCDVAYHDRHTIGPSMSFYFDFILILS